MNPGSMRLWGQYQHETADLLGDLGFAVVVNERLTEPNRTEHSVDVAARRTLAGISLLWVVECKLWNRRMGTRGIAPHPPRR